MPRPPSPLAILLVTGGERGGCKPRMCVHPWAKGPPPPRQLPAQQHQSLTLSGKLQPACVIALHLSYSFFEFLKKKKSWQEDQHGPLPPALWKFDNVCPNRLID